MDFIYADIELINSEDIALVKRGLIRREEIKQIKVSMTVNTGAFMMAINENIQSQLQFPFIEKRKIQFADKCIIEYDVVGPIYLRFGNRKAICSALVFSGNNQPVLGTISIGEMDVVIDSLQRRLIPNPANPDNAIIKMK